MHGIYALASIEAAIIMLEELKQAAEFLTSSDNNWDFFAKRVRCSVITKMLYFLWIEMSIFSKDISAFLLCKVYATAIIDNLYQFILCWHLLVANVTFTSEISGIKHWTFLGSHPWFVLGQNVFCILRLPS